MYHLFPTVHQESYQETADGTADVRRDAYPGLQVALGHAVADGIDYVADAQHQDGHYPEVAVRQGLEVLRTEVES